MAVWKPPAVLLAGWLLMTAACGPAEVEKGRESTPRSGEGWIPLFDGSTLQGWEVSNFGGEGAVEVVGGAIRMGMGNPLTGIRWTGDFPREDFEISLEAMKLQGNDFFCGLTFPVGEGHATLVLGGWGGGVTGLSSINGKDASENETTRYLSYEKRRWYRVRVRVDRFRVQAWLDGELIVDVPREGRIFTVRPEVRLSRPLGVANYLTVSLLRDIRWRKLGQGG
ncbi:MAG: hypothetical protein Kow00109_22100 [Acidobacteriota bacterium]